MIEPMGGPFRYNKKQRKRLRRRAKKALLQQPSLKTKGLSRTPCPFCEC